MPVFFTSSLIALTLALPCTALAYKSSRHQVPTTTSTNSHFCKCDTEGDRFNLVRIDISDGQKHETKVRDYSRSTHTLAQCEDGIVSHPSCR